MEKTEMNVEKFQTKVAQCMRVDCPSAAACLRQVVRQKCDKNLDIVQMVNPDAIVMEKGKCQFFRGMQMRRYGVGFRGYFNMLSYKEAKAARMALLSYFHSRAQLSRYSNGLFRITPEMKTGIDSLLKDVGVSIPLVCDMYEEDL